ncbi:MAG: hypothetical protein LBU88_10700 [Treponema sp.]|jgi:hypothetical protein|nr:hypothetical protein [Treponema sp.]
MRIIIILKPFVIIQILLILLFSSCASSSPFVYGEKVNTGAETIQKLGFLETKYEYSLSYASDKTLLARSHFELYKIAQKEYGRDVEIVNIVIKKEGSYKNIFLIIPWLFGNYFDGSYMNIHAKGEVIKYLEP